MFVGGVYFPDGQDEIIPLRGEVRNCSSALGRLPAGRWLGMLAHAGFPSEDLVTACGGWKGALAQEKGCYVFSPQNRHVFEH